VYLLTVNGSNEQDTAFREGAYFPLYENRAGKAILVHLPRDQITPILAAHDAEFGPQLRSELRTIKDQQLAYKTASNENDTQRVAASVLDDTGSVVGAVCVVGSTDRLSGKRLKEDVSGLVLSTARSIGNSY